MRRCHTGAPHLLSHSCITSISASSGHHLVSGSSYTTYAFSTCASQALVREGLRTGMAAQLGVAAGAVAVALASSSAAPATLYTPAATVASAPTVRPRIAALRYVCYAPVC